MKCPACGGDNREGARFCRHCGGLIAGAGPLPVEVQASAAVPADTEQPPALSEEEASNAVPVEPAQPPSLDGERAEALAATLPQAAAESGEPGQPPPAMEGGSLPTAESEIPVGAHDGAAPELSAPSPEPTGSSAPLEVSLTALPPGTVVAGRYLLVESQWVQETLIRYAARDLCRCWQCGFDANAPDDAFCAQCGASMAGGKAIVQLLQVLDPQAEPPEGETLAGRFSDAGWSFLVLAPKPPEPAPVPAAPSVLRLRTAQLSHPGQARPLNEDGLFSLALSGTTLCTRADESSGLPLLLGLYAVADGMGGHEGGEVASKLALHVFGREANRALFVPAIEGRTLPPEGPAAVLAHAVEAANDAVYLARQKRETDMGTTVTAALVLDDRLFLAHVGDCRALRWNAAGLQQLTTDHSLVASLAATGRIAPEEIYTHPQRSVIYRSLGDRPTVEVDTAELALAPGDCLVLCSDGLWEMLRNEGIADVLMQESDPQRAADLLVARANTAGGEDNISVIVVLVECT